MLFWADLEAASRISDLASKLKHLAFVPAVAALAILGGCGSGVHLEGPGFESLGLTNNKQKGDKKVPDRAPLLIPPDRARLPEPRQSVASAPPQNWPVDPGDVQKSEEDAAAKKQRDYEDKGDWSKNAGIDEFEKLMDPLSRSTGVFNRDRSLGDENRDFKEYEKR